MVVVQSDKFLHLITTRPITLYLLKLAVKLHQCIPATVLHMSLSYMFQPMSIMSCRIRQHYREESKCLKRRRSKALFNRSLQLKTVMSIVYLHLYTTDLYSLIVFPLSGLVANSVNFPTVATARKYAHEVHGSATGYVVLTVQCVFNNSYLAIKIV